MKELHVFERVNAHVFACGYLTDNVWMEYSFKILLRLLIELEMDSADANVQR